MKDAMATAYDAGSRMAATLVDCTAAAGELARAHLSGPAASHYLAQAVAGAALLGAETAREGETVTLRLDCAGPLGGFLAECTDKGTLRGYTRKKVLDDFDGLGTSKDRDALGETGTVEVMRSVPGALLSSGSVAVEIAKKGAVAEGMNAYFGQSLQRRVKVALAGAAGDDGVPVYARGVAVECPPDGDEAEWERVAELFAAGVAEKAISGKTFTPRTVLKKLGLGNAELRGGKELSFACRCSAERAQATLAALSAADREGLPEAVDVTCHMCGRTWTVSAR